MTHILFVLCLSYQLDPAVQKEVIGALARLEQFQVDFKQETYSDFFDETLAAGSFAVARPGKMRMTYTEGEQVLRIWDGKTAYERDAMADSESRLEQAEFVDEPIVRLLLYGGDIARLFLIDRLKGDEGDVFRLRPRDDDSYYVTVSFDKKWFPARIEVIGADGEGTSFVFSNYILKPTFAPDTFIVPPGE